MSRVELFSIVHQSGECIARNVRRAGTFFSRFIGLAWSGKRRALLLEPCGSIHTIGMLYPLDIVFLDESGVILRTFLALGPFRAAVCPHARSTLEFPAGTVSPAFLSTGDRLFLRPEKSASGDDKRNAPALKKLFAAINHISLENDVPLFDGGSAPQRSSEFLRQRRNRG